MYIYRKDMKTPFWTVGKRTLAYHFDEVNGVGLVRYYRRGEYDIRLTELNFGADLGRTTFPNAGVCLRGLGRILNISGGDLSGKRDLLRQ